MRLVLFLLLAGCYHHPEVKLGPDACAALCGTRGVDKYTADEFNALCECRDCLL